MNLYNFYQGKSVLITGHTGFKGSWLCTMLTMLGAKVSGFSLDIPTEISMFEKLNVPQYLVHDFRGDLSHEDQLLEAVKQTNPEIIIHLAAQPIVLTSYRAPLETFQTNVMGTASVLNCARFVDCVRAVVIVTTDKCYQNKNWIWGYRENDELGGSDPYSCSKACAELIASCYAKSYFQNTPCSIATARAGNVIGGGDWAEHRLIPDIVRAASVGKPITLRHPESVRPWQHVLEPLYGYLLLAKKLYENGASYAGAWNFGPAADQCAKVQEITNNLCAQLGCDVLLADQPETAPPESEQLTLDSTKAIRQLGWHPVLSLDQALYITCQWYQWDAASQDMLRVTAEQITTFLQKTGESGVTSCLNRR